MMKLMHKSCTTRYSVGMHTAWAMDIPSLFSMSSRNARRKSTEPPLVDGVEF